MKIKKIKFDGRRKTNISKKKLKELYEKRKLPISKIAKKFSCSLNTISYWIWRYNLKRRTASESGILFNKRKELKIPKEKLYNLFINKKLDLSIIAKKFNCSVPVILNRLRKYKISNKFSNCKRIKFSRKELKNLYENEKLTTYDISVIFGCCQATIWKRLKKFGIKIRKHSDYYYNIPSKKFLKEKYIGGGLSNWKIEKKYGYNRGTVYRLLKKYGFIKTRAEAHRIYPRKDFNGSNIDKAYMIGFRIGDLRVRKKWENSETINVDCGSTKKEQINLIKNLFGKYGRVWIKKIPSRKGYIQIEAFLNNSFSFLLNNKVPKWILNNKKSFLSFLAGFIDAEGCISINKHNQAYFSLGNYDSSLLFLIKNKLKKYSIKCNGPYESDTSNYFNNEGYGHNQNYWSLRIDKKSTLLEFLESIEPYIMHEKKLKDLKRAKMNIIQRNLKNGKRIFHKHSN